MIKLQINERLRELRIKSGYTQSQIAKILNIDRSTYSYYEIGKTTPDISVLLILSKVFNISINELLSDESNPIPLADKGVSHDYVYGKKNSSHIYELSRREKELVGIYRTLSKSRQDKLIKQIENWGSTE